MKALKRFLAGLCSVLLLCMLTLPALTIPARADYTSVSTFMEVTSVRVYNGGSNSQPVEIGKLNNVGEHYYGSFELSSDGTVTVSVPEIDGEYGMTVDNGSSSTAIGFQAHADSVSFSGHIDGESVTNTSASAPIGKSNSGHYVAALLFGAQYQKAEGEEIDDTLWRTVHKMNLAGSNAYYLCELNGTGSVRMSSDGGKLQVSVGLNASSYEYYIYGQLAYSGEDGGVTITMESNDNVSFATGSGAQQGGNQHIVIPDPPDTPGEFGGETPIAGAIIAGLGGAAVAAGALGGRDRGRRRNDDEEDEGESTFRMMLNKNFGSSLKKGDPPQAVYARIIERKPSGKEVERRDLTAMIQVSSYDNSLIVTDGGVVNDYKCAMASVPEDSTGECGVVTFTLNSPTGSFLQSVVFRITEAQIFFAQENLGLPANRLKYAMENDEHHLGDQSYRLPFGVKDMGDQVRVTASLLRAGMTDVNGNAVEKVPGEMPFSAEIVPDRENPTVFEAVIREVQSYELPAGTSEGVKLHLIAEAGTPGTDNYQKVERDFPIYRIHLGLALTLDARSIGCYMQLREERRGVQKPLPKDYEPCYTEGSLLLFLYRKQDMSIVRVPAEPEKDVKVTAKRLENSCYAHAGDADESHQKLVDSLGIKAFSTGKLCANGAHKIKLCSTAGGMDPPTRIVVELELTAKYRGKNYTVKQDVLLRSQPFRVANSVEESMKFIRDDAHIRERLERIQDIILSEYPGRLFSVRNMIERMLDGYDSRFGYSANQVENVMDMWTGFLEGRVVGANAEAESVTLADELNACYAFLEGLRDNTGFLGRVAMGVMTGGYSEYVFTTMTVAEELRGKVFACKGDQDYGFWDAVCLGTKEFGKQIVLEYAIKGVASGVDVCVLSPLGVDTAKYLTKMGSAYRTTMDKANEWAARNLPLWRMGDNALQNAKNFFNSSAKTAKAAIDKEIRSAEDAARQAEQLSKKTRAQMSAEELKLVREYEDAMEEGMNKLRRLQKAQQEMESITDFQAHEAAKAEYRRIANEVWTDKNALKQLQRNRHPYAQRMRAQFNQYRESLLDAVQLEALGDIAKDMHVPPERLYVINASNGMKEDFFSGKKVPGDRDISFKLKNISELTDRTKDITISQSVGQDAVARRLFRKMNGREAASIEEARAFMLGKDVTYVNPEGDSALNRIFEHNLDGYEDLAGMVGMKPDGTMDKSLLSKDLHNKFINQASVAHKGKEWFHLAKESAEAAEKLEAQAAKLTGEARDALLEEARTNRFFSQGQTVEGVRQITKQIEKIAIPRSIARNGVNTIPTKAMEIHYIALQVGDALSPAEFEFILRQDYGLTLPTYADMMSKFFD